MGSQDKSENLRWLVQIKFKGQYGPIQIWDIHQEIKTLKEALSYQDIIDDTVEHARIVDMVTDKVHITWR